MSRNELLSNITNIRASFPRVRYVVLTGGEVTLLHGDLIESLQLLTDLGLGSRIVSNGHWGRSEKSARDWVSKLKGAGLNELNLSTGDEHVEWVPFDHVARAAYHAVKANMLTLIVVEGHDSAQLSSARIEENAFIRSIRSDSALNNNFILITNIWMPFHEGGRRASDSEASADAGCDNIFENFVINPYGHLMSCCGLTMEYIPEIKVGNVSKDRLKDVYQDQFYDLLKLWIWLDGTRHIFERVSERLPVDMISPHPCSICAQLYLNPGIKKTLARLVEENEANITFRAAVKARVSGRYTHDAPQERVPLKIGAP